MSGWASWVRISSASMPPTRKKNSAVTPYMMPSFLWSTVNTHDLQPVVVTGRRNDAVRRAGADELRRVAATVARTCGCRSMMAIWGAPYFRCEQVGDDLVDLVSVRLRFGMPRYFPPFSSLSASLRYIGFFAGALRIQSRKFGLVEAVRA